MEVKLESALKVNQHSAEYHQQMDAFMVSNNDDVKCTCTVNVSIIPVEINNFFLHALLFNFSIAIISLSFALFSFLFSSVLLLLIYIFLSPYP